MVEMEFNAIYYPFYANLNPQEQELYKKALDCVRAGGTSIDVEGSCPIDAAKRVVYAIYHDRPELFWMTGSYTSYSCDEKLTSIEFNYNHHIDRRDDKIKELIEATDFFLKGLDGKSVLEKERIIHDRIANLCTYRKDADDDQSTYALLVGKSGVCGGYSRCFQYLMQCIGVPCYYCVGDIKKEGKWGEEGPHAWNVLKLGDGYYYVDMTWDDAYNSQPGNKVSYKYYNVPDCIIKDDHRVGEDFKFLPICKDTKYSFENIFGHTAELERVYQDGVTDRNPLKNKKDYENRIIDAVKGKKNELIELSFATQKREICKNGLDYAIEALKSIGFQRKNFEIKGSFTNYNNGWYKQNVSIFLK